ncbi:hypothetical protein LTR10_015218 [Elasticomyces elasticus]|uniref:Site-specific DNA-methyltransferase (adenine-specific) n=1 Tax=Exophiala sideris TaxID=1016849 RepID=A0ABR0JE51_9EURO|nr:hypothetical protein LTR10_015218 [Elasticomyces elasticus]KAK5032693.1 hypothetical protein LTS07_004103 [Exophiala sideris]KAK5037127.1 hypothetical protein LTR13_004932 [Exophiala sideris]KAK5062217.1 hypothetical protein LTR69_004575 [Exophiala sideris]KAK5182285.1 hypothetical protein LTR44_005296 [Eurotiomycetes sp. CCFEE 6388]
MPRLQPALIRRAALENRFLPLLLRICRDLPSARNELRWLHEHACETVASIRHTAQDGSIPTSLSGRKDYEEGTLSSVNGNFSVNFERNIQSRRSSDGVHSIAARLNGKHARNRYFSTTHTLKRGTTKDPNKSKGTRRIKLPSDKFNPNEVDPDRLFQNHYGFRKHLVHRGVSVKRYDTKPPTYIEARNLRGEGLRKLVEVKEGEKDLAESTAAEEAPNEPAVNAADLTKPSGIGGEDITAGFPMPDIRPHKIQDLDDKPKKRTSLFPNGFPASHPVPTDTAASTGDLQSKSSGGDPSHNEIEKLRIRKFLSNSISKRTAGMPLQYILGSQPFGDLDIRTPKGVLIPRPETEGYTEHIAKYLRTVVAGLAKATGLAKDRKIRILDLCTGSGCMGLLVHSILKPAKPTTSGSPWIWPERFELEILGVDLSSPCVAIANYNLQHNLSMKSLHPDAERDISFREGDVLKLAKLAREDEQLSNRILEFLNDRPNVSSESTWDVIIANPPYISPRDYAPGGRTESSVRKYEPKLALVPDDATSVHPGDLFYWPLSRISQAVGAKLLVMEVGDSDQARRVHFMLGKNFRYQAMLSGESMHIECWRDDGAIRTLRNLGPRFGRDTPELFEEARAIFLFTGHFAEQRQRESPPYENTAHPQIAGTADMQIEENDAELTENSHSERVEDSEQTKGSATQDQTSMMKESDADTTSSEIAFLAIQSLDEDTAPEWTGRHDLANTDSDDKYNTVQQQTSTIADADPSTHSPEEALAANQISDESASPDTMSPSNVSEEGNADHQKSEATKKALRQLEAALNMPGSVKTPKDMKADISESFQRIVAEIDKATTLGKHSESNLSKPLLMKFEPFQR